MPPVASAVMAPDSTVAAYTLWKMPRVFILYWVVVKRHFASADLA